MTSRLSSLLVPVTAWVMAAVLAFKITTLAQIAWADGKPVSAPVPAAQPPASAAEAGAPVAQTAANAKPSERQAPVQPAAVAAAAPPMRMPAPPPLPPDWKLLQDLRNRKEMLDRRSAELDARQAALEAAQNAIEQRSKEMDQRRAELTSVEADRKAQDQAGMQGLVKLYEDMRPAEAAAIFDALDLHVLLPILDKMNERKAAAIMGAMQPDRARFATQALARYRTGNVNAPPGSAASTAG